MDSTMKDCRALALAVATLLAGAAAHDTAQADGLGPIAGAIGETRPIIDARLRYESVEQTPLPEEADADTLRLRAGFETGKAWNTSLLAEGEFIWAIDNAYRDDPAVPINTRYPVVPDPETEEVNRLQLVNTSLPNTTVTLGRQRILLDDQRFIGPVGWRQNEQTFDALRIVNKPLPQLTLDATYLDQVNRIFGPDSPQGRYNGDSYLLNAAWQFPVGKLTGFGYFLDFDPITRLPAALNPVRMSGRTQGLRFAGERPLSKLKVAYAGTYATQQDYGNNPLNFDLGYYHVELTATYRQFSVGIGNEQMEGNGVVGFATPLATMHRFHGWADKFLTTPANGIDDRYASLGWLMKGLAGLDTVSATAVYRDFSYERGATDLGNEVDLQLQAKWQRFLGTVKYADYQAGAGTPVGYRDTTKFWLMVDYVW